MVQGGWEGVEREGDGMEEGEEDKGCLAGVVGSENDSEIQG